MTGLPVSLAFFTFLSLFITAGAYVVYQDAGDTPMVNPTDIVERTESVLLAVVAAITFLLATVGINLVANFIPPAYDLANLAPQKISFKTGGWITAAVGFVIGAFWVAFIDEIGLPTFVDTLGALLGGVFYYAVMRSQRASAS